MAIHLTYTSPRKYRDDITGLRALAVITVVIFHIGHLPNGYLGVDIFFVISGYLITTIILNELKENCFTLGGFYLRRARRILPLSLFVTSVALVVGIFTMLPDDLENLAQSVVATNFFSNNILQAITTKNYWDVVNEYKPLMHTWSLGIEEQYYFLYPLLISYLYLKFKDSLTIILSVLVVASLLLYLSPYPLEHQKFYHLPYRFYELAAGGVAATLLNNKLISHNYSPLLILLQVTILLANPEIIPESLSMILTIMLTTMILISANENSYTSSLILENKPMILIGSISFSLYMWHQVILAFTRYFIISEPNTLQISTILVIIFILSLLSYKLIEQPFRKKSIINNRLLALLLIPFFIVSTFTSIYIYSKSGVLKDVPELSISKSDAKKNMHSAYNHRNYMLDKEFSKDNRQKVLVIGNSFARDWINVLLESNHKGIEISYIYNPYTHKNFQNRAIQADIIFYSTPSIENINNLNIDQEKLWVVGTKNFGYNNGIYYNYRGDGYYKQRTKMENGYIEENNKMKNIWKGRYINYIDSVIDSRQTVPVFTPSKKFISQDCRHLTKAGAIFYAKIFNEKLIQIFKDD